LIQNVHPFDQQSWRRDRRGQSLTASPLGFIIWVSIP
jgi:hypothetical protein